MARTMYEVIMMLKRAEQLEKVPTKELFGKQMHDEELTDEEKFKILEAVEEAGGYDGLPE